MKSPPTVTAVSAGVMLKSRTLWDAASIVPPLLSSAVASITRGEGIPSTYP